MTKVGFIVNKGIRNKARFYYDLQHAKKTFSSLELIVKETNTSGSAIELGQQLAQEKWDVIVAVGGDGTLHEVVNGVMQVDDFKGYVSVLPYGTANDFCKSLLSPRSIMELIQCYKKQSFQPVTIGRIVYHKNNKKGVRYFINIADLGMGADVVKRVNRSRKRLGPDITFMKAIIQTFWHYKNHAVNIMTNDWHWEGKINTIAIANGKYFGSGLCIAPDASLSDENFDIVIIGNISLKDYLKNVNRLKRGQKINHPQVFYKKASSISIEGINSPCAIECDGEFLGHTPVKINLQASLNFLNRIY